LFVALGSSPIGRAGLATFSILALAALAAAIVPLSCRAGAAFCGGESAPALLPATALAEAAPVPTAAPRAAKGASWANAVPRPGAAPTQVAMVTQTPASLNENDLIARTFAALDAGFAASVPAALTSRKVQTVGVHLDGTPVSEDSPIAAPAPLVAEAEAPGPAAVAEPPDPAASAAPAPAEPAPVPAKPAASPAPQSEPSLAYAPANGDAARVTGQGANVRSVPQVTGSDVLFALRGGADVTIVSTERGWAKIVDASGRSGWIYAKYLRRQ